MDGTRNVTWLLCFRCTGSFGLTASVKGTPAARRGRKATALDSQEEQEGWAAGTNRPHQVLQRQPVGSFSVEGTPLSRLPAHRKRRKFAGGFMSKKPFLTLLSTAALSAVAAMSVPVSAVVAAPGAASKAEAPKFNNKLYIVRLAELPVVAYNGGIKGLPATKPKRGQKIDPNSPGVVAYKAFLESRQSAVLAGVGGTAKVHSYGYTFNGFSAELTEAQVAKLQATPGVVVGHQGQPSAARDGHDPSLPRLDGRRRLLRQDRREGRGRHHRHRRQRRLARASQLLGSHRHQRQRHAGRQAGLPADPRLARPVHPGRQASMPPTATRS